MGQFLDEHEHKCESVLGVKSIAKDSSVNGVVMFATFLIKCMVATVKVFIRSWQTPHQ